MLSPTSLYMPQERSKNLHSFTGALSPADEQPAFFAKHVPRPGRGQSRIIELVESHGLLWSWAETCDTDPTWCYRHHLKLWSLDRTLQNVGVAIHQPQIPGAAQCSLNCTKLVTCSIKKAFRCLSLSMLKNMLSHSIKPLKHVMCFRVANWNAAWCRRSLGGAPGFCCVDFAKLSAFFVLKTWTQKNAKCKHFKSSSPNTVYQNMT